VKGTTSYRALVSFAAADLAIRVIRAEGDLSTRLVRDGTWSSALYTFSHGVNENERVVVASADGWFTVNTDGSSDRPENASSATVPLPGT
jgi:hypothetical protein